MLERGRLRPHPPVPMRTPGRPARRLIRAGVPVLRVRRLFQCASFLGCAASALPLSLAGAPGLGLAVGCLTANLAFYSARWGARWACGAAGIHVAAAMWRASGHGSPACQRTTRTHPPTSLL